jgi:putative ABC transport system ATP-binding protein
MSVTHIPQMAIETRHLYKRFGDITALDDINLRIARGEFVAIMGASGSGKTTLMNILTCLDTATEGQVILTAPTPPHWMKRVVAVFAPRKSAWCSSSST